MFELIDKISRQLAIPIIRCGWCDAEFETRDQVQEHLLTCQDNPSVKRIAELEKSYYLVADAGARESNSPEHLAEIIRNTRHERDSLKLRVQEMEEQQRWIPVSENLPKEYGYYFAGYWFYKQFVYERLYFLKNDKYKWYKTFVCDDLAIMCDKITHWRYLPQPPKDGE